MKRAVLTTAGLLAIGIWTPAGAVDPPVSPARPPLAARVPSQPAIIGERVEFAPANPLPGQAVTLTVHFRVQGGPVSHATRMEVVTTPPAAAGPTAPTIILGSLDPGRHVQRFTYTIPDPAPSRICFSIVGLIRDACLESRIAVASIGVGLTTTASTTPSAAPAPVPGGVVEKPDLAPRLHFGTRRVSLLGIIPLSRERFVNRVTVQNIGRAAAGRFDVQLECMIMGGWVPCAMGADVDGLPPGGEAELRFTWVGGRPPTGIQELKVVIDRGNAVDESNEDNNSYVSR